MCDELTYASLV